MQKLSLGLSEAGSAAGAREAGMNGQVYFVRHGESTSNERNIFAGVLDVPLTPYGRLQARRAGQDLRAKQIVFDAVYVSHLRRARQTCEIVLQESQSLRDQTIRPIVDHRISERSTGILTGENKNLCRLALGHERFEEMIHAYNESAPGGETIESVYERVVEFYEQVIEPRLNQGENILIVCHEYVLEPLAVYLAALPASAYKRLKLPNAKALSKADLVSFRDAESSHGAMLRKSINDQSAMLATFLYALFFVVGASVKAILQTPDMPDYLFRSLAIVGLCLSTFYTYLSIDFKETGRQVSQVTRLTVYAWWLLRWLFMVLLLVFGLLNSAVSAGQSDLFLWGLLLLVPPALTAPSLSMIWGGNIYPSAALSKNLSLIIPPCLLIFGAAVVPGFRSDSLAFFVFVLLLGLALPALLAQRWRLRSPVQSHHHANEYKFIGVLSVLLINGSLGYQLTPLPLFGDIFPPEVTGFNVQSMHQLMLALALFTAVRLSALLTQKVLAGKVKNQAELKDVYILLTSPNFLLWLSLVVGIAANQTDLSNSYLLFWAAAGFTCLPLFDQEGLVPQFSTHLLRESLKSSRLSRDDISSIIALIDTDQSGSLDPNEIRRLLWLIEERTTGQHPSDEMLEYAGQYLMNILDQNNDGVVSVDELKRYISVNGLAVNLNLMF